MTATPFTHQIAGPTPKPVAREWGTGEAGSALPPASPSRAGRARTHLSVYGAAALLTAALTLVFWVYPIVGLVLAIGGGLGYALRVSARDSRSYEPRLEAGTELAATNPHLIRGRDQLGAQ